MQLPKKSTLVIAIIGILLGLIRIMNILVFSHIRTKKGKRNSFPFLLCKIWIFYVQEEDRVQLVPCMSTDYSPQFTHRYDFRPEFIFH